MSLIGTEVKPFTAQAYHNGKFVELTEANLKGKWSVVCFYPADFTFVCPTELEDLQNQYAALQDLGVEVYSVSTDTHFTHKACHIGDQLPNENKGHQLVLAPLPHRVLQCTKQVSKLMYPVTEPLFLLVLCKQLYY